ncbi:alpha/beta fold hydrolase [Promicromonospora thailandica]|uniref:Pimeloyl-ACP methyl ester carboxylesterase n=1 Tax=Promicromonospora thailandica TaxID=765201 RepID=A0A9X2G0Z2_9MICO|nr:alpha/beta hydrolase [Promicromonospora thailandica]MCP2263247.1 Pimeloyl-ACP methyl ester carboxylesterase [Promicromonospora thailandica]BFF18635.1 CFTR inhibitory factor Cif [Promicromonospora thailandica]
MRKRSAGVGAVVAAVLATAGLLLPGAAPAEGPPSARAATVATAPAEAAPASGKHHEARPPAGYSSHHARVNGFRMHYLRGGSGSPVVLLHGFPQTWAEWRDQLGPLAEDHTVIAVDLRGTGDSGVPKGGYDTVQLAQDVHDLLTQLGLNDGIQIVAHDIGAWVAYPYAAMWPDEVERMALMEGPIPDESIYGYPALDAAGGPSIWHYGFFQQEISETLVEGSERELVEGFIGQFLGDPSAFGPADYEFYARYLREPGRWDAWLKMYRALHVDVEQNAELQARGPLPMPILAIGGEKSLGTYIGTQLEEYASDVETRVLPGAGHWVTEERPHELTQMLRTFLR